MKGNKSPCFFTRLPEQFGGKIPFIVTDLVSRLRELNAINEVGLFRLNGSQADINEIIAKLDKGKIADWSKYSNVHTLANCLKKYFRDKVEKTPFFPATFNNTLEQLSTKSEPEVTSGLREIILQLPKARIYTLAFIGKFLVDLKQNNAKNKMNASNIAIVIGPNFFNFDPKITNILFCNLLQHYDEIFNGFEVTEQLFLTDEDMEIIAAPPIDTNGLLEIITLRKSSVIPYVPSYVLNDPNVSLPTRKV
ncbi:RhoGAP domain containing protein [Trichomonas vaginalis G3]|uniref:RhoGAP domain containing protein n=1 Tax=Trichomonas vaginalis (strain ATCC PRA-98 / G3) TaxID=412133 RepID=A2FV61_TRIV3|nr:regulation of protein localization to cell-cell adherens junction [Trichomonas vaginalis G3]EAX91197.1 RhoGAP domain containing protein [Trichomonas vaginalis G3]KAI5517077.1 regulation of protein localization to cell-cell adherens junction [Trichomonas vaginalis G3]|eukprot:XP_001304127.1 RhoGAP domain containing protein [Trichomonas vaginalis G3]